MERALDLLSRLLIWAGGVLIIGAVLVTVCDVLARWLFKSGFIGLVDVTQFAVIGFAYLAMPRAFLTNAHVAVALYDHRLSPRGDLALRLLALILTLGVFSILLVYGWTQAERTLSYGDVSQNIKIPMIAFWTMVLIGTAFSFAICLLQLSQTILKLTWRQE